MKKVTLELTEEELNALDSWYWCYTSETYETEVDVNLKKKLDELNEAEFRIDGWTNLR